MSITYKSSVTPDEMNVLRASVGFRQIAPEQLLPGWRAASGSRLPATTLKPWAWRG